MRRPVSLSQERVNQLLTLGQAALHFHDGVALDFQLLVAIQDRVKVSARNTQKRRTLNGRWHVKRQ